VSLDAIIDREGSLTGTGIFTTASTNLIYATNFMALIALYHTDLVIQPWMTFVAYQGFNILTGGVVMFGNRYIPLINKFSCELILPRSINLPRSQSS
jgi:hypothetical protein